jgi:hypothetical protein
MRRTGANLYNVQLRISVASHDARDESIFDHFSAEILTNP